MDEKISLFCLFNEEVKLGKVLSSYKIIWLVIINDLLETCRTFHEYTHLHQGIKQT